MNVWLLTTGEYSDFRIEAVFDDEHREEGNGIARLIGGNMWRCLTLNEFNYDEPPEGMFFYRLEMMRDGSVGHMSKDWPLERDGTKYDSKYNLKTKKDRPTERKSYWRLHVRVYARDEKHATKMANEIRTQILAGNKPEAGDIP